MKKRGKSLYLYQHWEKIYYASCSSANQWLSFYSGYFNKDAGAYALSNVLTLERILSEREMKR